MGTAATWHRADVTDQAALNAAVAAAVSHFGRLDVVITNAGIANMGTVPIVDVGTMARVIDVNVIGTMRTIKAALPHIIASKGYVLVVSSAAAFTAMPGMSAYAASKAAVEQLANVLRLEMMPHGVSVGSAHMSWVDTDMVRDVQQDLSSCRRTLAKLPGPFGVVSSLEACTAAFVNACDTRAERICAGQPGRGVGTAATAEQRVHADAHDAADDADDEGLGGGGARDGPCFRRQQRGHGGAGRRRAVVRELPRQPRGRLTSTIVSS